MLKFMKNILMITIVMLATVAAVFADVDNTGNDTNVTLENTTEDLLSNVTLPDDVILENVSGNTDTDVNVTEEDDEDDEEDEDEEEVEVVTDEEADILSTSLGAQMRLLQLQKRIKIQIETGEMIIEEIKTNNPDFDTSRLEEIIEEFYALAVFTKNDSIDETQSNADLVKEYVGVKKTAIDLSQEFKKITKDALSDAVKTRLRNRAKEIKENQIQQKTAKIEQLKNRYRLQQLETVANKAGLDVEEYRQKLMNNETTIAEIKNEIKNAYKNMSNEERKDLKKEVLESKVKKNIQIQEKVRTLEQEANKQKTELQQRIQEKRAEIQAEIQEQKRKAIETSVTNKKPELNDKKSNSSAKTTDDESGSGDNI